MNKLDSQPVSLTLSPVSNPDIDRGQRLIVLTPYFETDLTAAAQRICELAYGMHAHVKFLGLYHEAAQELSLRRQLVTMSAIVSSGGISTETEVVFGRDWVDVVRQQLQAGDTVACFAKQRFGPLSNILQSNLHVPIYFLSGPDVQNHPRFQWLGQITAWTVSMLLILGFFVLQVKLDDLVKGEAHTILPLLSIPIEIWIIWAWNSLFK